MKKGSAEKQYWNNKELLQLALSLPIMFFVMVAIYLLAVRLSYTNGKICNYLGRIWVPQGGVSVNKPEGCYTYRQLAEIKFKYNE